MRCRLAELNKTLVEHDRLYFEEANPRVSDADYDALAEEARRIERKYPHLVDASSRSRRIGSGRIKSDDRTSATEIKKHTHLEKVLSLTNAYDTERARKLLAKVSKAIDEVRGESLHSPSCLLAEPKLDGVSITVRYDCEGNFMHAATRGDGSAGEDVSEAVKLLRDVPLRLCEDESSRDARVPTLLQRMRSASIDAIEVRGELFMPKSALAKLREEGDGALSFSHSRNAAAGTLRRAQSDPEIAESRGLQFAAYAVAASCESSLIGVLDAAGVRSQTDLLRHLSEAWGFLIPEPAILCTTPESISDAVARFCDLRSTMLFDIDGIVFKANPLRTQQVMGRSARAPRWATAFKFPAQSRQTRVRSIRWQVSRFGVLTPVADLDPVEVGGATVRRATLHNTSEVLRIGVRSGSSVIVERAGEVIPRIVRVVDSSVDDVTNAPTELPTHCPACNSKLVQDASSSESRCVAGLSCSAQREARLLHFVGRSGLAIPGFGAKTLSTLCRDLELVSVPADVLNLRHLNSRQPAGERLEDQNGWGRKSAEKLFDAVENRVAAGITLSQLIGSLGIPRIGKSTAAAMAQASNNDPEIWLEACRRHAGKASETGGVALGELGSASLSAVRSFFEEEENVKICEAVVRALRNRAD
eukprot:g1353.t1